MTPRRAAAIVTALCLAAVAAALGASALVRHVDPHHGTIPDDVFAPLRIPKVDVHQHLAPGTSELAMRVARVHGIETLVNLSGGSAGVALDAQLAEAGRRRGHVIVFMNLDLDGCCDGSWGAREAARL